MLWLFPREIILPTLKICSLKATQHYFLPVVVISKKHTVVPSLLSTHSHMYKHIHLRHTYTPQEIRVDSRRRMREGREKSGHVPDVKNTFEKF